jgi:hypothetical protein
MIYVALSALCALLGNLPLFLSKKVTAGLIAGGIEFLFGALVLYSATPSTVWPLFGAYGGLVFVWWIVAAIVDGSIEENVTKTAILPVVFFVLLIGYGVAGSQCVRTDEYKNLIGQVEERTWTQDVQPKDPKHMRMSTEENALYQAAKVLGTDGAIGSQFTLSSQHMTLQMVNGELWFVVPLDFRGFTTWTSSDGVPAYVMIHGEDVKRQPILKNLPEGQRMRYMPGAYFSHELERHLRSSGFMSYGLTDYSFEIDENGKPWWVVTAYKPTIVWNGEKTVGIVLVDPVSGETQFHALGQVPEWVDRAVPDEFIKNYLAMSGEYVNGWLNSWWGKRGITRPEEPVLIYGSDGQPEFVTGITSHSNNDDSLVALVYTNSRTGKSVRYTVTGGATDSAIINAVDKNSHVQYKKLHAVAPQIYNVYGTMTCVVPLLNDVHAFQGVALVPVNNPQIVAVGEDQYSALREYEKILAGSGQQIALDKERDIKNITGIVDRFNQEITASGQTYFLHITDTPHIFTGGAGELSTKLPLTKAGDKVRISFYASGRDVVPMHEFDNLSLTLSSTADQKAVNCEAAARIGKQETVQDAATALERIKKLPPDQLKALGKGLK